MFDKYVYLSFYMYYNLSEIFYLIIVYEYELYMNNCI